MYIYIYILIPKNLSISKDKQNEVSQNLYILIQEIEIVLTLKGILVQYIVHHLHITSLNIVLVLALLRKTIPIDRKRKTKYGYMCCNRFTYLYFNEILINKLSIK